MKNGNTYGMGGPWPEPNLTFGQGAGIRASASVQARNRVEAGVKMHNVYRIRGWRKGELLWTEEIPNLTVTEGLNDILTQYFKGSVYTATWFVGLINNASFSALAAGDTAAQINGSNGWIEATAYSQSVRQTLTLGSASAGSIDNSASAASFSINATITLNGAFVVSNSTKAGTSGKLYGEASFAATRSLINGDTVTVTVTLTAASV